MPTAWDRTSTSSGPICGRSRSATTALSGASNTSAFMPVSSCALSSVQLHPAGDVDPLARHVARTIRGQEGDRLPDVLGLLGAPQWDRVDELLPRLVAGDALVLRQLVEQRLP